LPPNEGQEKEQLGILACGMLKDELRAILQRHGLRLPVSYLGGPPCLESRFPLERAVIRASGRFEKVVLFLGRCLPSVDDLVARYSLYRLPMDNCFDALLEGKSRELYCQEHAFLTTPAWLKSWRSAFQCLGWDEATIRQHFGLYQRILMLDPGLAPIADEALLELSDHLQLPVDRRRVDLEYLTGLLHNTIEAKP